MFRRSVGAAARSEEAGHGEGLEVSGQLSGPVLVLVPVWVLVLVLVRVHGPAEEAGWCGLRRPRYPSCRRTDLDWPQTTPETTPETCGLLITLNKAAVTVS